MEDFMKAIVKCTLFVAVLALAIAIPGTRVSAAPNPQVKSGVDRLYVIDCGDGSASDESRWTPGANIGKAVGFPGHCYLIHHTQGWILWDTGVDDAVAQLPNHELVLHEWGLALARSGANQLRSRLSSKNYTSGLRTSS
jgi:hypothetical protein